MDKREERQQQSQQSKLKKSRWRHLIEKYESSPIERALETLVRDLQNLAIFDLVVLLANVAIIVSLVSFLTGGERQRHDEQVYTAWQVITSAYGQPGNGGRRRALEFLNSSPGTPNRRRWFGVPWPAEKLYGVDVSGADIVGVNLPNALLDESNFQEANLSVANFKNASLTYTNFRSSVLLNADELCSFLVYGEKLRKGVSC